MNNELAKRIEWINLEEQQNVDAFRRWMFSASSRVLGKNGREQLNNEICDYVDGLLTEIGDLQETIARLELNDE